jgi:hypothetical protein
VDPVNCPDPSCAAHFHLRRIHRVEYFKQRTTNLHKGFDEFLSGMIFGWQRADQFLSVDATGFCWIKFVGSSKDG